MAFIFHIWILVKYIKQTLAVTETKVKTELTKTPAIGSVSPANPNRS